MDDLEDIKDEITTLVFLGKQEEALGLLQQKYEINREEAEKLLAIAVKESVRPSTLITRVPQLLTKGKGCKKTVYEMIAYGFGFFGIPSLLVAFGIGIYFQYDSTQRIKITGIVVEYNTYYDGDGVIQYAPIVSYTVDDHDYSHKATLYSHPPAYEMGGAVPLFVDPTDPESVYIDSFYERWFVTAILGGIGFLFTFLMIVFTFMGRRL